MRLKNLTITITLGCLSLVALAGLVMLPISDGVCEWSGNTQNKTYTNSSVDVDQGASSNSNDWSKDTQMGRGWWISASLNATGYSAYASVSPSIYGVDSETNRPEPFNRARTYGGTANVCVSRKNVTYEYCVFCGETHDLVGAVDSNEDKQRSIWAQVVEGTVTDERMTGKEIDKVTGHLIGSGIEAEVDVAFGSISANAKYEWTRSDGKKFKEYKRTAVTKDVILLGDSEDQEASVGTNMMFCYGKYPNPGGFMSMPARTSASLDFNIGDADNPDVATPRHSSSNSVSYDPDDDESSD